MHRQGLGICISIGVSFFIVISLQCFHFICLSKISPTSMQDLAPVICLIHWKVKVSIRKRIHVHSCGSAVAGEGLLMLSLGTVHQTFITETSCILCPQLLASAGEMLTPHELKPSEFQVYSLERPIQPILHGQLLPILMLMWHPGILKFQC